MQILHINHSHNSFIVYIENEMKNMMIDDLRFYSMKLIRNNLRYKLLLKERSRTSMVHDRFQDVKLRTKINL